MCNFANDNTVYPCGKDLPKIKENLIRTIKNILKWFRLSSLKANPRKFQIMILSDKTYCKHILKINSTFARKAQYKLHVLQRLRKFLTIEKAKILGNDFIDSQFNYAPLLWIFCRKTFYSKI